VLIHTWERTWQYIKKAGTIILAISILVWASMSFPQLPEDAGKAYADRKAPFEEQQAALASTQLADSITELEKELAAQDKVSPGAKELQAKLDKAKEELASMPVFALRAEVQALQEQLEALSKDPAAERLQKQINEHSAAVNRLDEKEAGAKILKEKLAALSDAWKNTPAGAIEEQLRKKQEELESLPETQLEAELAALQNEEARDALLHSYAGRIGIALEPFTSPAGFDWRTNIALVAGIAAKEVVVATLGTAYSLGDIDEDNEAPLAERIRADTHWTSANAVALLLFTLLYSPCIVALAMIRQETGKWRWLFFSLFFNLALAYAVAIAGNQIMLKFS
jgi:chromosome segregation ATPase